MINLRSGKTDEIIVIDTTPTPPTLVDPVLSPEEIVGNMYVTWYDLDSIDLWNKRIFIKRSMLGTSIEVFIDHEEVWLEPIAYADILSFNVTPTTIQVTQTDYNVLSVQIPTEILEEDIKLNVTLDYTSII